MERNGRRQLIRRGETTENPTESQNPTNLNFPPNSETNLSLPTTKNLETTGVQAESFEEQKTIRQATRRALVPLTWVQYEAGWAAYREKPTIAEVAQSAKVSRAVAAQLIEHGYPEAEMMAYGERISEVRKVARQIEDYNLSRAMAENGQILRGIKFRLREALGDQFSNLSFDASSLSNLTPNKALVLANFMDKLMRLEAYTLREGSDETKVLVEHHVHNSEPTEAAGKLARLINEIETAVQTAPFAGGKQNKGGIVDAEIVEEALEEFEEFDQENGAKFDENHFAVNELSENHE